MSQVAPRYAKALFDLGVEHGNYERIGREVRGLARAIEGSPELAATVGNPAFPRSDRERLVSLPDIARELELMIDAKAGRIAALVTTAAPLAPAQEQALLARLEARSGKKVQMKVVQDATLLGGLVVKLGDVVYDGSLKTQLERMRDELVA
jgi:F-type H+-transporting ATPase subunit delta